MNYFSSFSFSFRYYSFLLFHKIDLIRLRYPILYTLIYNSLFIIFFILLHTHLEPTHPILCQPDSDSNVQDLSAPPTVNYETKPVASLATHTSVAELDGTAVQQYPSHELDGRSVHPIHTHSELDGRPICHPTTPHTSSPVELGVNYPNTSSVFTERDSVPSNINELGVATPSPSPTNTPQLVNTNESQISFYSGADSSNTSLISETGSTRSVIDRFDADDYTNVSGYSADQPDSHPYNTSTLDIGYRAPTPIPSIPSTRYDYTERIITKQGVLGRLKVGFKSLGTDIEEVCLKYHDLGKRKFF